MRIEAADTSDGSPVHTGESPYRKQARRDARKRDAAQAAGRFVNDVQTGVIVALALFAVGACSIYGLRTMGYESEFVALKHLAAGTDCVVAKAIDMAPAKMDQPGYWMHLDADKDGTTCEE